MRAPPIQSLTPTHTHSQARAGPAQRKGQGTSNKPAEREEPRKKSKGGRQKTTRQSGRPALAIAAGCYCLAPGSDLQDHRCCRALCVVACMMMARKPSSPSAEAELGASSGQSEFLRYTKTARPRASLHQVPVPILDRKEGERESRHTDPPKDALHCMVCGELLFCHISFLFCIFGTCCGLASVIPRQTPPRSIIRDGVYHLSRLFFPFLAVRIRAHLLCMYCDLATHAVHVPVHLILVLDCLRRVATGGVEFGARFLLTDQYHTDLFVPPAHFMHPVNDAV